MSSAEASGERGIAIGRDAIHSIFATGDHNQFFVGETTSGWPMPIFAPGRFSRGYSSIGSPAAAGSCLGLMTS